MAMMRTRRPSFRPQPSLRPMYQDFKPKSDMTENPESHVLLIQLPGFTKERIKVQYDDSSQLVRVSGERPIDGGNKRSRFREAYPVPQNCNINKIQSNFRQGILTIIMPKKIISLEEPKPTQEEQAPAGSPTQKPEQAIVPPKPATTQQGTGDDQKTASSSSTSGTGPSDIKAIPSQKPVIDSQKPEKELTMAVAEKKADVIKKKEKKADGVAQKVKEETESKPTLKLDQGKVEDERPKKVQQEIEPKPKLEMSTRNEMEDRTEKGQEETEAKPKFDMAPNDKMDEKPQKGQAEIEPKPTSEMVPSKPLDEKPVRGQEGINQNATLASIPGEQSGEKLRGKRGEDVGKERISKKEIVEEGKPYESIKTGNGVKEKSMVAEKEITERRELFQAGEYSVPKIPDKGKGTTTKAKVAAAAAKEGNLNDGMMGTIGKGIKEGTTSASQAITRIAEGKWDNEDKPLLLNIGASILVLAALGGYALYRFTSS